VGQPTPTWDDRGVDGRRLGRSLRGIGSPLYSINQLSVRQMLTPERVLGRVNASRRFIVFGISPIGALIGGA